MTKEPSDAETCLHVSISEANKSDPFRGMTTSGEQKNGVPGGAPFAFYEYGFLRLGRRIT